MNSGVTDALIGLGVFVLGLGVGRGLLEVVRREPLEAEPTPVVDGPAPAGGGTSECATHPSATPAAGRRRRTRTRDVLVVSLTGAGFVLAYLQFGLEWYLLLACLFISVMVVVAFIDLEHMIIPNRIVLPAAPVGLAGAIALDPGRWWAYMVAAVGASLLLFVLALIRPGGMGMGDVKLALFMGAVLGTQVITALFLAFLLGAVVGIVLLATRRKGRKDAIPFGPHLALGSVLALLYGEWMLGSYLGLMG